MPLDLDAVGRTGPIMEQSWTATDAMLYALGVGAGQDDPLKELAYTTENSEGVQQQALSTFAVVLLQTRGGNAVSLGDFDRSQLVHAEQAVTLFAPLPVEGRLLVQTEVVGIWDKGSGALAVTETRGWPPDGSRDKPMVTTTSAVFIKGQGGFGRKQPAVVWTEPSGEPSHRLTAPTRHDQALLYRLGSGDRNPLHSDPVFAARGGFDRPILHGLCTYGTVARVLLGALAGDDNRRLTSMIGRFTKPVMPGEELTVEAWATDEGAAFRALDRAGDAVLSRGKITLA
ncbi:enoyl-CoA hydratase [Mycobacterium sp. E2327]|uniref:MaoC/PaaZ C-terminal domain-containing protein n=1 Tax=Mycobacterium sp. E2327 TaxID=1834132 RepID=UPI0008000235|nr:MaoC/PaaZ C-terminal domain-containing protein [Mycobacterium sp. E2327]OBI15741.1 enoyl-CoA hydratase [Mycobacterium sp. E2327]